LSLVTDRVDVYFFVKRTNSDDHKYRHISDDFDRFLSYSSSPFPILLNCRISCKPTPIAQPITALFRPLTLPYSKLFVTIIAAGKRCQRREWRALWSVNCQRNNAGGLGI